MWLREPRSVSDITPRMCLFGPAKGAESMRDQSRPILRELLDAMAGTALKILAGLLSHATVVFRERLGACLLLSLRSSADSRSCFMALYTLEHGCADWQARAKNVLPQHEGHASSTAPRLGFNLLPEVDTTQEMPTILHDASRWPHPHNSDTPCVLLSCTLACLGLERSLEHHITCTHAQGKSGQRNGSVAQSFAIRLIRFCRTLPDPCSGIPRTVSASPRMGGRRG
ncbi:hypothetical protein QBC34DRAFT_168679 [Podospora aff. communis PSN243]|uniref:Uncharacterized protein n=1 Tax=Podospora aff. communis PSN243 TaxID=3040156 RepID=A0AAV9GBG8_9PEZI|nr:hypothetical protein QBC34DRAFT_168679 [Podospora aff. communis PSN243]